MIKGLGHIGIAVEKIEKTSFFYELLGFEIEESLLIPEKGVKVLFLKKGDIRLELLEPLNRDSVISKFLSNRGEGLHHISLMVKDIDRVISILKEKGVEFIDKEAQKGAKGRKVAFIHPSITSGVLIEIEENET